MFPFRWYVNTQVCGQGARPIAIIRELREGPENGYEPEGWQSSLSGIPRIFGERFGRERAAGAGNQRPKTLCSELCSIRANSATLGPCGPLYVLDLSLSGGLAVGSFPSWMSRGRSPPPAPSDRSGFHAGSHFTCRCWLWRTSPSSGSGRFPGLPRRQRAAPVGLAWAHYQDVHSSFSPLFILRSVLHSEFGAESV